MSASAHRGDHDIAFYEAAIENTAALTAVAGSLAETSDDNGPLPPGRYLIQAPDIGLGQVVWVHVGKFTKGAPLTPSSPIAAGEKRFPLTTAIVAVETHVLGGYSDRIATQLNAGPDVTLYISRVSSEVRKGL